MNITKKEIFDNRTSEEIDEKDNSDLYFAKVCYDYYGLAVRDNSIEEIINLGKEIEKNGPPE